MKKIYYLILITFTISSCKQDCKEDIQSPHTIYKPIVPSLIPYIGYEKLKFLHNNTDTLTFYGQGIKTDYNYSSTQDDCPSKIPLENKYLIFIDSTYYNSFLVQLYIASDLNTYFLFKINNNTIYNGDFSIISKPYQSIDILGVKYDTISYKEKQNNYLYYKTNSVGMLKFKTENDIFELIP
jgi:hypothetical protein